MAIEIVDFPIENGGSFHSYVSLPEGSFNDISQQRSRVGVDIVLIDVNCLFCCRIFMNFPNLSMPVEQSQVCWSWDVRRAVKKEHIGTHRNSVRTSNPGVFTVEATGQDSGRMGQRWSKQMGMDMSSQIRRTKRWRSKMSSSILKKTTVESFHCVLGSESHCVSKRKIFRGSQAELLPVQGLKNWLCFLARIVTLHDIAIWDWINTYKNTIFSGMNIHKSQIFWCELQGYRVLTHPHMGHTVLLCLVRPQRGSRSCPFSLLYLDEDVCLQASSNGESDSYSKHILLYMTLHYIIPCYVILLLCCIILYYTILCYVILYYVLLCDIVSCYVMLSLWCYIILHCIIFNSILLYYIILYRIVLYYKYCIVLYYKYCC